MGDIIQSIPFIRRLRRRNPDVQIDLFVERCFADVAALLPGIDNIIEVGLEDLLLCFDREQGVDVGKGITYYRRLVDSLRLTGYHEVWNLTHTKPFTVLSSLVGGEHANGVTLDGGGLQKVNKAWLKYFYATNLARPWCQFNLVDIYANCIDEIPEEYGRSVAIEAELYKGKWPAEYQPKQHQPRVAIHPGASQKAKMWLAESYMETAKRLNAAGNEIVLIGGKSDRKLAEQIALHVPVINLVGKTAIKELAAVLADCDLLISNDSGPMHMAAAVGTTVIAITLGSALGSETAPYGENHWVIEPKTQCYPCVAEKVCRHQSCANLITTEHVVQLANSILYHKAVPVSVSNDQNIRLYRTTQAGHDAQLELIRYGDSASDERELRNHLLRGIWPLWLDGETQVDTSRMMFDPTLQKPVLEIISAAKHSERLCREIADCNPASQGGLTRIETLSMQLYQADQKLNQLLGSVDMLKSVLAYLMIEKGSVAGDTLPEQARQTAALYRNMTRMLSAAVDYPAIKKSKQKKDKEVYYENLA